MMKKLTALLLALLLTFSLVSCSSESGSSAPQQETAATEEAVSTEETVAPEAAEPEEPQEEAIPEYGSYTTAEDVALYIYTYGCLPANYISKSEGNAEYGSYKNIPSYMNIGGDRFYNREGLLPGGHTYYECDIGTSGGRNRGAQRLVFTLDGIVYYTSDHYRSFTRLY